MLNSPLPKSIFYFPSVTKKKKGKNPQSHYCSTLIISCKKHILSTFFVPTWVKEALWFRSRTSLAIPLRESLDKNLFVKITSQKNICEPGIQL